MKVDNYWRERGEREEEMLKEGKWIGSEKNKNEQEKESRHICAGDRHDKGIEQARTGEEDSLSNYSSSVSTDDFLAHSRAHLLLGAAWGCCRKFPATSAPWEFCGREGSGGTEGRCIFPLPGRLSAEVATSSSWAASKTSTAHLLPTHEHHPTA